MNYFVKSKYPRRKGDFYPTIDSRCIQALTDCLPLYGLIVDPCAPTGSGVVDSLISLGYQAKGQPDAFKKIIRCNWIITNPPYKRGEVEPIIKKQIERIGKDVKIGVAMLLRTGFDHAKSYKVFFKECPRYAGQIKLTFRPRWIEDSKGSPIHNYVWHVWTKEPGMMAHNLPWVIHW